MLGSGVCLRGFMVVQGWIWGLEMWNLLQIAGPPQAMQGSSGSLLQSKGLCLAPLNALFECPAGLVPSLVPGAGWNSGPHMAVSDGR